MYFLLKMVIFQPASYVSLPEGIALCSGENKQLFFLVEKLRFATVMFGESSNLSLNHDLGWQKENIFRIVKIYHIL